MKRAVAEASEDGVPRRLWAQFDAAGVGRGSPEWFDHAAGAIYLRAEDPSLQPDQLEILHKLMRLERLATRLPLTTAYEDLALYSGRTTLGTLVRGLYGEFLHYNKRDLRISKPPNTLPRKQLTIHLVWSADYNGAASYWKEGSGPEFSYASQLQGLMALVLDDLRAALHGLRVRYRLHRAHPALECPEAFSGGMRWRGRRSAPKVPQSAVRALFSRCGHVESASRMQWQIPDKEGGPRDWWLAGLLACDLPSLGLSRQEQSGVPDSACTWSGNKSRIDSRITHLLVCADPRGKGGMYRIRRTDGGAGQRLTLDRLSARRVVVPGEGIDPSFLALRTQVMDLALEQVWARMV